MPPIQPWLAHGPCDIRILSSAVGKMVTADANLIIEWADRESGRGNAEAIVIFAELVSLRGDASVKRDALQRLSSLVTSCGHPNAAYALGIYNEFGRLGLKKDVRAAAKLYEDGWKRFRNVGCAVGLKGLAMTSIEKSAADERLIDFISKTNALAAARATGSESALGDAAWHVAEVLEARESSTYDAVTHAYDVGASAHDPHCMLKFVQRCLGGENNGGFVIMLSHTGLKAEKGKRVAAELLAMPETPIALKSAALSTLGSSALSAGQHLEARKLLNEAISICERAREVNSIDKQAIIMLTMCLMEGMGGTKDEVRGRIIIEHGVRMGVGPSLCIAAKMAQNEGDLFKASQLWKLGAAAQMPEAIAVVENCTIDEANNRIGAKNPVFEILHGIGGNMKGISGRGIATDLVEVAGLKCAACERPGRASEAYSSTEEDLNTLTTDMLRARLTKLHVPFDSNQSNHADLVIALTAAQIRESTRATLSACECARALYCDRKCQLAHWAQHKIACKAARAALLATPTVALSHTDLDSLSIKKLKAFLTNAGVEHAHCVEKSELLSLARELSVTGTAMNTPPH